MFKVIFKICKRVRLRGLRAFLKDITLFTIYIYYIYMYIYRLRET